MWGLDSLMHVDEDRPIDYSTLGDAMSQATAVAGPRASNPLPNLGAMGKGVDVLFVDLQDPGIAERQAVFAYKATQPAKEGMYPKQMSFTERNVTTFDAAASVIQSAYDMRNAIATHVSVGGKFQKFAFTASAGYKDALKITTTFSDVLTEASSLVTLWQLTVNPGTSLPLDPSFLKAVTHLPPTQPDSQAYPDFIAQFGTHYYTQATFGGRTFQRFTANDVSMATLVSQNVSATVEAGIALRGNVGFTVDTKNAAYKQFAALTQAQTLTWVGGHVTKDWTSWVPTVSDEPLVVSSSLLPIHQLFTTTNFPGVPGLDATKTNMQAAVDTYVTQYGTDPTAGQVCYRPFDAHPTGMVIRLTPLTNQSVGLSPRSDMVVDKTKQIYKVQLDPLPGAGLELINPTNASDTSPCQTGDRFELAPENQPAQRIPSELWLVNQADAGVNLSMRGLIPSGIWKMISPFNPRLGEPVFDSDVVQLQNFLTNRFLAIANSGATVPSMSSDGTDPRTCWLVRVSTN